MNKKPIILFCVFLVLLTGFSACKKHSKYGVLVVDKQGMEHVIMTDANGVTVIDREGNLVEIMTDSANKKPITVPTENGTASPMQVGDYQTHAVTFPGIVESGDTAEDAYCSVALPEGWEQIGSGMLILHNPQTDARIMIYTDMDDTVDSALEKLSDDLAVLYPEGGYDQSDVTLDGLPATRTQYEIGEMTMTVYLLRNEIGKVCRINTTVETAKRDEANTDEIVKMIHFK